MSAAHVDEWTGRDVRLAQIERQLGALREETYKAAEGPDLRTNVLTHMAWVPREWRSAAEDVLAGLAERHPSRTIFLKPEPEADDGLNAELSVRCFPLPGEQRNVCSEVIELSLGGRRVKAPASIVEPLLLPDLPVFLRWRGQPPFGQSELEQLLGVTDRLIVDSSEWPDLPGVYERLEGIFQQAAVSDIAWARTFEWRRALAPLWPGIAGMSTLGVTGPRADALLLAGWLRSRLQRTVALDLAEAEALDSVSVDGEAVDAPTAEVRSAADLLSAELDNFGRDPIYEAAVEAAQ